MDQAWKWSKSLCFTLAGEKLFLEPHITTKEAWNLVWSHVQVEGGDWILGVIRTLLNRMSFSDNAVDIAECLVED